MLYIQDVSYNHLHNPLILIFQGLGQAEHQFLKGVFKIKFENKLFSESTSEKISMFV